MKAFQAHAKGNTATAATPRAAAEKFFKNFPTRRKCSVIEGEENGIFFTIKYGRKSQGEWPQSWKDVTPRTVADLPDTATAPAPVDGGLQDRYDIYAANTPERPVKTFDEWLSA